MTSKEILQASFLEILFEHRNKEYGAYALRKFYNNRLGIALGATLSFILLLVILLPASNPNGETFLPKPPDVVLSDIEIPKPFVEESKPVQSTPQQTQPIATQAYTNNIQFVNENITPDVPNIGQWVDRQIGIQKNTGLPPRQGQAIDANAGTNATPAEVAQPVFDPLEVQPQFPGGAEAWAAFLSRYLRVPDEIQGGERKTVLVKFIVAEDGKVTAFEVVQSGGAAFDNEVIRVLKKMPQWKPAIQNGQNVKALFTQPVTFQSVEE